MPLPEAAFPGSNILILEPGTTDATNRANWSDMVVFTNTTVQLLFDGCNTGIDGDVSCFPTTFGLALAETPPITTFDTANGIRIHYRIHEDTGDAADTPEPNTMGLVCCGLGLVVWKVRRS